MKVIAVNTIVKIAYKFGKLADCDQNPISFKGKKVQAMTFPDLQQMSENPKIDWFH